MGAPFWSNEEKQYFLQQIVPRSHYANGYYESTGRSFEDLAQIMQRDLDDRNLSRRTYSGDLLFQHWYQKVRPTLNHAVPLAAQAADPTATAPQDNAQASGGAEQGAVSPNLSTDEDQVNENSEADPAENDTERGTADTASSSAASFAQDIDVAEVVNTKSASPLGHSTSVVAPSVRFANGAATGSVSATELPLGGHCSPSVTRSTAIDRASTSTKRSHTQNADPGQSTGPTKKFKRDRKPNPRLVLYSDSNDDEFDSLPRELFKAQPTGKPSNLMGSMEKPANRTHSGLPLKRFELPLSSRLDGEEDPYRLRHPIPIQEQDPFTGPSRGREGARGLFANASGAHNFRVPGSAPASSSTTRHPLASSQPFTQDRSDVARLHHRVATDGGNGAFRGAAHQVDSPQHQASQHHGGPGSGSGSGLDQAHAFTGSGPMITHPVTGERLGEVVLQGPTFMTYCPSCQRPF